MKNREGQEVPIVTFKTRAKGGFVDVTSDDIFKGRTVAVFALPGAFTPTCSSTHLPRYNELAGVFRENGVDEIVCISVNDAFVMDAWRKDQEAENVTLIPDGNGDFSAGMGMMAENGMDFEEIVLGRDATIRSVRAITGKETVPQVFIDGDYIGGSEELEARLRGEVRSAA